jgi:hypothetical protein
MRNVTGARFWCAWSFWAVTITITATAVGYDALHPLPASLASQSGNGLDMVVGLTFIVAFATVGALLAWKKPENPIGWLLSGSGLAYALGGLGQMLIHFPRTRTLGNWLGWTWLFGLGLCVFVVLLFPAGSLPSRRWRPAAWVTGAALAGWVLANAFAPRRGPVHPGPAAGAAPGGPEVQPGQVRRRPDRGRLRRPAEGHRRAGLGPRRPDRHRVPGARAGPRIGLDQRSAPGPGGAAVDPEPR